MTNRFSFDHWGWQCLNNPAEVVPINDTGKHSLESEDCPCKPFYSGDVLVHNSFDGREHYERDERKTS